MSRWEEFKARRDAANPPERHKAQMRALWPWFWGGVAVLTIDLVGALVLRTPEVIGMLVALGAFAFVFKMMSAYDAAGDDWDAERGRRTQGPKRWDS